MFEILMQKQRAGHGEIFYHASICLFDGNKFYNFGQDVEIFGRSLMKPFQVQMFKDELSDLSDKEIAISVASHNGTSEHIEMAKVVGKENKEDELLTTVCPPLEPGEESSKWSNPCSGKHSAIIRGLKAKGLDHKGYNEKDHDYDLLFKAIVEKTKHS